jgi:hypothetical protein
MLFIFSELKVELLKLELANCDLKESCSISVSWQKNLMEIEINFFLPVHLIF